MALSRRALAGAGAAMVAAAPAVASAVISPDAALLLCCAEYQEVEAAIDRNDGPYLAAKGTWPKAVEDEGCRLTARLLALFHFIAATPARTAAGLQAKAGIVRARIILDSHGRPDSGDPDDLAIWSLLGDVVALTAGRA